MAGEGIVGVAKRVLVSPDEGWDGWVMRLFEVEPGGHTPRHSHPWPHINFVPSGRVRSSWRRGAALAPGSYAFVPGGVEHQFRAAPGRAPLVHLHRAGGGRLLRRDRYCPGLLKIRRVGKTTRRRVAAS